MIGAAASGILYQAANPGFYLLSTSCRAHLFVASTIYKMSDPSEPYDFLTAYLLQRKTEYRILYKRWCTELNAYDWPPWHWGDKCVLVALPHELILMICEYLYQADVFHLALSCRLLADFAIPLLYARDVTQFDSLSLRWGCTFGIISTLELALNYGASVDHAFDHGSALGCDWIVGRAEFAFLFDSPLKIAIAANEVGAVRFLCGKGANVNSPDVHRFRAAAFYPIHWAIGIPHAPFESSLERGNPKIVRILLEAGADPNQFPLAHEAYRFDLDRKATPMSLAMHRRVPTETVSLLLHYGADTAGDNELLRTAPHRLISFLESADPFNDPSAKIRLLLAHADPADLLSAFHRWLKVVPAAYTFTRCEQVVKITSLFVSHGVDLVGCAKLGVSPIVCLIHAVGKWAHCLWRRRRAPFDKITLVLKLVQDLIADMCEATLVAGESPGVKKSTIIDATNFNPDTPNGGHATRDISALQIVCTPFGFTGRATLIQPLLRFGADLENTDSKGAGVLHYAAMFGPDDRLRPLLEFKGGPASSGLDVDARDSYGWTPLHFACLFSLRTRFDDQTRTAKLLLDYGADVRARTDSGWTCVEFAFWCGNDRLVSLLLDRGARPEDISIPPGWESKMDSQDTIWFCDCDNSAVIPFFHVAAVVEYSQRFSSTTAHPEEQMRSPPVPIHCLSCRRRPCWFPYGWFRRGEVRTVVSDLPSPEERPPSGPLEHVPVD
ncbi:ankyrin repeat-containing domain protein [Cladorrhinum samala]|uniref:Ankyrin repeat-containing domain protein n=1 Tax=Cladorrhinum samala TaxID=585594 RepID=A0AAV9I0Y1_9PEZI|nr:ankyrin repeat-containing domain protein [Cladorrhinum samala]